MKLLLDDDESEANPVWQDILRSLSSATSPPDLIRRYGYTKESKARIDEIDDKLAEFEQERQRFLSSRSCAIDISPEEEENTSAAIPKLPQIVGAKSSNQNQVEEEKAASFSRPPEKVIGDSYLKEQVSLLPFLTLVLIKNHQKMATVRRKYSQQLDLLLSMVHSQVSHYSPAPFPRRF